MKAKLKTAITIQPAPVVIPAGTEVEIEDPTPIPPPTPTVTVSRLFSPDSFWNKKLTTEKIHSNSANFVRELFENVKLGAANINCSQWSTPIYHVNSGTPKVQVYIPDDNKWVQVPLPDKVKAANGEDGHLTIIDTSADKLYEFWQFRFQNNRWEASDMGIIDNLSISDGIEKYVNGVWNTATATHLPIAAGTFTLSEIQSLTATHGARFAINRPKPGFVWPAQTGDGWYSGPNAIPEGMRFRFPANITIDPSWTPLTKFLVQQIRDYGMTLSDKTGAGCSFYFEDPTPYGKTDDQVIRPLMGNREIWNILGDGNNQNCEFPWLKLQALA